MTEGSVRRKTRESDLVVKEINGEFHSDLRFCCLPYNFHLLIVIVLHALKSARDNSKAVLPFLKMKYHLSELYNFFFIRNTQKRIFTSFMQKKESFTR